MSREVEQHLKTMNALSDPKERGDCRNELIRPRVSRQEDVRKMISALEDQLAQQEPRQLEGGHYSSGAHTMETSKSSKSS